MEDREPERTQDKVQGNGDHRGAFHDRTSQQDEECLEGEGDRDHRNRDPAAERDEANEYSGIGNCSRSVRVPEHRQPLRKMMVDGKNVPLF